jgi:catechol 2,3-dioxygenase-like lactoylglutathione lyase family enzyme
MPSHLGAVAFLVKEYDEAIEYFTRALQFQLIEDTNLGDGKRWVLVRPKGASESALLLAKAVTSRQRAGIGNQSAGRVGFFLHTDDFKTDHAYMVARGVLFHEEPRQEAYGTVAVFEDLYGNKWDLLQLKH